MVDLHHHLLSGLDDGATTFQTSVAMARMAADDGITHIVCTPHANESFAFDPATNDEKIGRLREALAEQAIPLTIGAGCDFHLSYDNIQTAKSDPARFSINGLGYLLVELPDYGLPRAIGETFYQLQMAGLTPILTHPERNATLQVDLGRMRDWLRGGLLLQVTADSVIGKMGKKAEKAAHQLLADRWVHFLATDAHNTTSRPPRMRAAERLVAKRYGEAYATLLCRENPMAAFLGRPMPDQMEPLNLYEEVRERPWWQRLNFR